MLTGFDFTFTANTIENSPNCGVLRCSEEMQPGSSGHQRKISSLTVYKFWPGDGAHSGHWGQMARVTSDCPNDSRTSDDLSIIGDLKDVKGTITLNMFKPEDCTSAEFSCEAVLLSGKGDQPTLMRGFVQSSVGSENERPEHLATWGPIGSVGYFRKDESVLFSMREKLNCVEKQVDRLGEKVDNLKDAMQLSEIRVGEKLNKLDNRLEDKFSACTAGTEPSETTCSKISSKLSAVTESVETIERNLTNIDDTIYRVEKVASLSVATVTMLDSMLTNLTSGISTVSNLTVNMGTELDSFRSSYLGGALIQVDEFFDALGTGRKEWRLAFRGTAYINVAVYPAYLYGTGIPVDVEEGCKQFNHNLPCSNHYRSRESMENWNNIDEVLFAIYDKGQMVKKVVFNARSSNYVNWFDARKVIDSSWSDLTTRPHNFFSIAGNDNHSHIRRFYISHSHNGCDNDYGWFAVSDSSTNLCPWEKGVAFPSFHYSSGTTVARWQHSVVGHADSIGVFLKYH